MLCEATGSGGSSAWACMFCCARLVLPSMLPMLMSPRLAWRRVPSARERIWRCQDNRALLALATRSNGTGRGVPLGATSGSESVDIPWQELIDAISTSNRELVSALGKVRMDVRSPGLEPLGNLMEDAGADVCIISSAQPGTGLPSWLAHFLSTFSSPPPLHLISVGWWLSWQEGLRRLRATVTGRHVGVRTIEALSHLSPSSSGGLECKVGVVDLDSLGPPQGRDLGQEAPTGPHDPQAALSVRLCASSYLKRRRRRRSAITIQRRARGMAVRVRLEEEERAERTRAQAAKEHAEAQAAAKASEETSSKSGSSGRKSGGSQGGGVGLGWGKGKAQKC